MKWIPSILYYLLIIILIWSCDPAVLPPVVTQEVAFSTKGLLGNDSLRIEAGRNEFYLYTDFQINDEDIYEFNGRFAKIPNCTSNCQEALSITINNYTEGFDFNINEALSIREYALATNQLDSSLNYQVAFQPIATATSFISARWDFGNGTGSNDLFPTAIFQNNSALVELETRDLFGNKSRVRTNLDLENGTDCQTDFFFTYQPFSDTYTFQLSQPSQSLNYNWTLNDGQNASTSTGSTFSQVVSTNQLFEVCLEIEDNGCTSQICKVYNDASTTLVSASTFAFEVESVSFIAIDEFLSKATIEYTTPNGVFYSTKNGIQPSDSRFEVIDVEDFFENENGLPTKKITANIQCSIFDETGNEITLNLSEMTFAVAYPE